MADPDAILDALQAEFISTHPQHARADALLGPEAFTEWVDWLQKIKSLATLEAAMAEQPEPELPVARKLRTGVEPSENDWIADEWHAWKRAGRSEAEFAEAFRPDEDDDELLPVTRRLLSGGVE